MKNSNCAIVFAYITDETKPNLSRLPRSVILKSNSYNGKRRLQYLAGRILLAELLHQKMGIAKLPEIDVTSNGRPYFTNKALPEFNISHSDDYVIVAISNNGNIGLDLEYIRPRVRLLRLAEHRFSSQEVQWLKCISNDLFSDSFWRLWTLRESILKLAGKGVWQMKEITIDPERYTIKTPFLSSLYCVSAKHDDFFWAISVGHPIEFKNISIWQANAKLSHLIPTTATNIIQFCSTHSA